MKFFNNLFVSVTREEAIGHHAVELRLDLFPNADVKQILQTSPGPVLLTLRKASHGGQFQGTESEREALIEQLLALEPPFFDLEWDMRPEWLEATLKKYPKTQFILSQHGLQGPIVLPKYAAFSYKIAAMALSTNDALKLLLFAKRHPKVSAICMGKHAAFARVLGPVFGNLIGYASPNAQEETAPGQLSVQELIDVYNYHGLNEKTAIYGLIGDPVEQSSGHLHHNAVFQKRQLDAVYVKMRVTPDELPEFIALAKTANMRGLSVTMPLKEKIVPLLDAIDPGAIQIGAVNTLRFDKGRITGTNTDGLGALDAIEKRLPVRGARVVLLGAGGAARAIAFEAKARGAEVWVLNRTLQRAVALSASLNGIAGGLDEFPSSYDVLINCSPAPLPIDPNKIQPGTLVMDIVRRPRDTLFLQAAAERRCQIVYGEEMFINQAIRQTDFWLEN